MLLKLAWRSLWRNQRRTLITLASIAFGLTLAIFFVSLSAGIHKQVIGDATRMVAGQLAVENPRYREAPAPDLRVRDAEALAKEIGALAEVEGVKRRILADAVIKASGGSAGVSVVGVEPSAEGSSPLARSVREGRYLAETDERGILVGRTLAEQLELKPGKKVVLSLRNADGETVEELLHVIGIFDTGSEEIDGVLVQLPLSAARRLLSLGPDEVTQLGVLLRSPDDQSVVLEKMQRMLGQREAAVRTWQELLPELSGWNTLDGSINRVLCGVILFLILFTILNTLMMSVLERVREFGTLLALGTPPARLRLQVLLEAAILGLLGCALGSSLGSAASYALQRHGLDVQDLTRGQSVGGFAFASRIHSEFTGMQVLVLATLILVATILLAVYPIIRSTRLNIADVIRSR